MKLENLEVFLKQYEFKLSNYQISKYFGDFCYTFTSNLFELQIISDRSLLSFSIKKLNSCEEPKYDLILVKNLVNDELELTEEGLIKFLHNNFHTIENLFNNQNYISTKSKLESIRKI